LCLGPLLAGTLTSWLVSQPFVLTGPVAVNVFWDCREAGRVIQLDKNHKKNSCIDAIAEIEKFTLTQRVNLEFVEKDLSRDNYVKFINE
jgi:hypothetical protein